jgi:hypothetical protein
MTNETTRVVNTVAAHRALLKAFAEKQLIDAAIEQATDRLVDAFARPAR